MYQQLIDHLKNKRIVLLGMGREGHSTYNFIRRYLPEQKLIIADAKQVELDNDPNVEFVCGDGYLGAIDRADIVIKTPGIPLLHFKRPQGVEITCQTDLFLRFSGFTCVGVTGTKGKTSITYILRSALENCGIKTGVIGTVGAFYGDKKIPTVNTTPESYELQKILREAQMLKQMAATDPSMMQDGLMPTESLRYAMALVAGGPMLVVFPFFQKYFAKGMTIGAVKG